MRTALLLVGLVGCLGGDDGPPPKPDAPVDIPGCVTHADRGNHTVTVSATIQDFVTSQPLAGVTVEFNTAWDTASKFPTGCPAIDTFQSDAQGLIGPKKVEIGSTQEPPIAIYLASGGGIAKMADDARVTNCMVGTVDCGNLGHFVHAPSAALADTWRTELAAGGMPAAATRGLVLFLFKNLDGSPAMGVTPKSGTLVVTPFMPDMEVRFLNADRMTLAPRGTTTTTASGIAVIGAGPLAGSDMVIFVAGSRATNNWAGTGTLVPEGYFFYEDKTQSP